MTSEQRFEQLRELSWRRNLTEAEAAELSCLLTAHPHLKSDWEAEAALNEALRRLPNVPVASNFTARVLLAIERDHSGRATKRCFAWHWWRQPKMLVRAGLATSLLAAGLLTIHVHDVRLQQARMIQSLASVSPEVWTNFEVIVFMNNAATDRTLALARPDQGLLDLFK